MNIRYLIRSKLFVPGSRQDLFPKALNSNVDAVSLDLEDAVQEALKAQARKNIANFLASQEALNTDKLVIVRVNDISHPGIEDDIKAIISPRLDIVNLPKVESAEDIDRFVRLLSRIENENEVAKPISILANIETPKGLRLVSEIATASTRIMGLQIGFADLFGALGINRTNQAAANQVRLQVKLAAGEACIAAYDAAFLNVKDIEGYKKDCLNAKNLGFAGKSCIHPSQVDVANQIFSPNDEDIARAKKIIEYISSTEVDGAFLLDGQMIDKPVIEAARQVLKFLQNGQ